MERVELLSSLSCTENLDGFIRAFLELTKNHVNRGSEYDSDRKKLEVLEKCPETKDERNVLIKKNRRYEAENEAIPLIGQELNAAINSRQINDAGNYDKHLRSAFRNYLNAMEYNTRNYSSAVCDLIIEQMKPSKRSGGYPSAIQKGLKYLQSQKLIRKTVNRYCLTDEGKEITRLLERQMSSEWYSIGPNILYFKPIKSPVRAIQ
jgi:hypothetical protein